MYMAASIGIAILMLPAAVATVMGSGRAPMIVLLAALTFIVWWAYRRNRIMAWGMPVLTAALIPVYIAVEWAKFRFFLTEGLTAGGNALRVRFFDVGWDAWLAAPLFGHGPGQFLHGWLAEAPLEYMTGYGGLPLDAHNLLLAALVEVGVLGVLAAVGVAVVFGLEWRRYGMHPIMAAMAAATLVLLMAYPLRAIGLYALMIPLAAMASHAPARELTAEWLAKFRLPRMFKERRWALWHKSMFRVQLTLTLVALSFVIGLSVALASYPRVLAWGNAYSTLMQDTLAEGQAVAAGKQAADQVPLLREFVGIEHLLTPPTSGPGAYIGKSAHMQILCAQGRLYPGMLDRYWEVAALPPVHEKVMPHIWTDWCDPGPPRLNVAPAEGMPNPAR